MADNLYILIAGAMVGVFFIVFLMVFLQVKTQQKLLRQQQEQQQQELHYKTELLHSNLKTLEDERARIAADLHDDVGASLAALRMQLARIGKLPQNADEAGFADAKEIIDHTIGSVKRISYDLLPPGLSDFGLEFVVNKLFETIKKNTGFDAVCHVPAHLHRYGNTTELALFRIVQELTNNSIKHSGGSHIYMSLLQTPKSLTLTYLDDGIGYHYSEMEQGNGLGLKNIKSRASLIGATVTTGKRNELVITLPTQNQPENA